MAKKARITSKQKSARRKNMAVARAAKKKSTHPGKGPNPHVERSRRIKQRRQKATHRGESKKHSTATADVVKKVKKNYSKEYKSTRGMGSSNKRAQLALLIKGME